jgi:hypothetical protein
LPRREGGPEVGRHGGLADPALAARDDQDSRAQVAARERGRRRGRPGGPGRLPAAHLGRYGLQLLGCHHPERHIDRIRAVHAVEAADGILDLPFDPVGQGAALHGQTDVDMHAAALDGDALHHAQVDDAAMQLRILYAAQALKHRFLGNRDHAATPSGPSDRRPEPLPAQWCHR